MKAEDHQKMGKMRLFQSFIKDPRYYQIFVLASLTLYGFFWGGFNIGWEQIAATVCLSQLFQYIAVKMVKISFDPLSSLISSLSLCILLRSDSWVWIVMVIAITIFSKFLIRYNGKHIFNPTTFSLAMGMLLSDKVWMSPGQWGTQPFIIFFIMAMGGVILNKSKTMDVTLTLLVTYVALIFGRALYLGDPISIPIHQLTRGALILFAFYMISDPKTNPNTRKGRILFGFGVALLAFYIRFGLFIPNATIWALVFSFPLVPLIDKILPGEKYHWPTVLNFQLNNKMSTQGRQS